ncbi:immunity 50 family protein [Pseudomonas sp. Marseille-Q5115]|uniref:immunity 50 family protein n=1 Tax=Pseudomonas sp. Marseille-Q5115 TaxID=2866593 RepID=UPI001CE40A60|nr:immunity 50 family protein [Pseudomonas sp. Marseille-Q5115]
MWFKVFEESSKFSDVFGLGFIQELVEFDMLVVHDEMRVSFYFRILGLPDSAPVQWIVGGYNAAEFTVVFHNPLKLEVSGARSGFDCAPVMAVSSEGTSLCVESADTKIFCIGKHASIGEIRPYTDSRIRSA